MTYPSSYLTIDVIITWPPSASQQVPSNVDPAHYWHNDKAEVKFQGNVNDPTSIENCLLMLPTVCRSLMMSALHLCH